MNRFSARELATFDKDLSHGAARLYAALDEYARESGVCWPKQGTLADRIGCSVRQLQRFLGELAGAGLCSVGREVPGGRNKYRLIHAPVQNHTTQMSPPRDTDVATHTTRASRLIRNNQGIQPEGWAPYEETTQNQPVDLPDLKPGMCMSCYGRGYKGPISDRSVCGVCLGKCESIRRRA